MGEGARDTGERSSSPGVPAAQQTAQHGPLPATETVTIEFRMAADHIDADRVHIVGEFNGWSRTATPMTRAGSQFVVRVRLAKGRSYRYKFLVDGERWENDWHADAYVSNEYGGDDSVIDLRGEAAARWTDPDAPGRGVDDPDGPVPEPNEPA
jgi:1,4-alpha-glucan branching enzyme